MKFTVRRRDDRSERRGRIHPLLWLVPAAILLRLLLFLGRGDFVAFDESWYLLLGRHLWAGDGYTLTGLRHTALPPLFPVLAGALDLVTGDIVRAGRVVAAVAAGALVIPCWSIFRRLAGRRTALLACVLIAALPSLAPFAVPYWVGWDLWMGPEPVYHFFLFAGIALVLRAFERGRPRAWLPAGGALALAYLARPEAIIVGALLGLAALVPPVLRRAPRTLARPAMLAVGFAVVAAPYWIYLHDTLGRWTISGRDIRTRPAVTQLAGRGSPAGAAAAVGDGGAAAGGGSAATIEGMIWRGEQDAYVETLYALDASGERLANSYWGVPARPVDDTAAVGAEPGVGDTAGADTAAGPVSSRDGPAPDAQDRRNGSAQGTEVGDRAGAAGAAASEAAAGRAAAQAGSAAAEGGAAASSRGRVALYIRALGIVLPGYLWIFAAIGLLAPRRRRRSAELLAAVPLALASLLIAGVVAVDPRTQLLLAPMLAFYSARGIRHLGIGLDRRVRGRSVRRGLVPALLVLGAVGVLLFRNARTVYLSVSRGSPHHVLGAYSRMLGGALQPMVDEDGSVMSWDPAVALYAGRDWRVLPYAPFDDVIRYANAIGSGHIVLADYYPAPDFMDDLPGPHLVIRIPHGTSAAPGDWRIELVGRSETHARGVLRPSDDDADVGG